MTSTAVDPAILRVVGDVGRPERGYDALSDTRHIPGKDGLLAGLANLWGWMRHGHAHLQTQAEKHGPLYRGQVDERRASDSPDLFSRLCRTNEGVHWLDDVTLGGHHIPAGTVVGVVLSAALRDPSCWTEPDRFDPERFGAERSEGKKSRGAYMPFGAGAHSCVGAQLSALEAKAFWHTLLRKARFQFARPYPARHEFKPLGSVSGNVELSVEAVGR